MLIERRRYTRPLRVCAIHSSTSHVVPQLQCTAVIGFECHIRFDIISIVNSTYILQVLRSILKLYRNDVMLSSEIYLRNGVITSII